jgi:hypothetical protein
VKVKKPYSRYLRERGECYFTKSGFYDPRIIPHGWKRYRPTNVKNGFPNHKKPVPRYWFAGELVHRIA